MTLKFHTSHKTQGFSKKNLLLYYAKIRKEHFRDKNHSLFKYCKSAEQEIESSSVDQIFLGTVYPKEILIIHHRHAGVFFKLLA